MLNKEKTFISAVIYLYNNESQISYFLDKFYNILNENFERFEIICVNDCSTDEGVEKFKTFASKRKRSVFTMVNMGIHQGVENSLNAGVDLAIGDFVFEFDSLYVDYPLDVVMKVYTHSLKGFDIVSASPEKTNSVSLNLFYSLFNSHSGSQHKLREESFRILSRRAINRVHSMSVTVPYRKVIYANSGLKTDIIVYQCNKNSKKQVGYEKGAANALILFTDVAYKITMLLTVAILIFSIAISIYTILEKGDWITMVFLSWIFVGVFFVLTIVIKYLLLLTNLVFVKQRYLIESVDKI